MEVEHSQNGEKAPLFKKWSTWYILVILNLVFLIFTFYIITKIFT